MNKKILTAVVSSIVSLFLIEVAVRILSIYNYNIKNLCFHQSDNSSFDHLKTINSLLINAPHPLKPGSNTSGFILNSRGFRTPEYQVNKPPNSTRIITIGDSFTFSSGPVPYPFHFTRLLEAELKKWFALDSIELINLGLPSIGPLFEQRILELEGIRLNPDLVIWCFFVGNDFTDETPLQKKENFSFKRNLLKISYLSRLVRNGYILYSHLSTKGLKEIETKKTGQPGTYVGLPRKYDPVRPTFEKERFLNIQTKRMRLFSKDSFPWQQWERIQTTLMEVKNTCLSLNIPLLFVIIPEENQVNSTLLEEVIERLGKSSKDFDMDFPQTILTEYLAKNDIEYLDLLSVFNRIGEEKTLYLLQDTHWNVEGNRLAAETILQYLTDRNDKFFKSISLKVESK